MRIGVLSDTHIPLNAKKLPDELIKGLKGVDLIIHAGDIIELSVLDELKRIAPVEAVAGNMDPRSVSRALPEKKILELGGFKIGVMHGSGPPYGLIDHIRRRFEGEKLDCIIYGHAHKASIEHIGRTIFFNPGSPTDKVMAPYNSYGILEITDKITPKIIKLKS